MFRLTIVVALTGILLFPSIGLSEDSTEADAVLATEDDWVNAEANRDEATLRRVLDDQFVLNSNNGQTSGKEAMIESVLGSNITGQTITERSVVVVGNTAVVFGTTEIRFGSPGEESTTPPLRYTTVYVKRSEQWRAVALHMTQRTDE